MGALGTLGVGLSVLFGIFLAVLAGELYYMICCRRSGRGSTGSSRRRVSSVQVVEAAAASASASTDHMGGFAREAALVGSFGGYAAGAAPLHHTDFVSKFFPPSSDLDDACLPHTLLFPIAEETKEEMELQAAGTPPKKLPANHDSVVPPSAPAFPGTSLTIAVMEPFCASSTSVSFSVTPEVTPFATPPSSPSASDTSSDSSLSSPARSTATAASRFSAHSWSPASASSSPATAASRFSLYSQSPSSAGASPTTANSRLSVNSPASIAVSPAGPRLAAATPTSSSPGSHRSSVDATSVLADHGSLGALFRRQYNSPSRYSPLRPVAWPGHITDFRHALPFSPDQY